MAEKCEPKQNDCTKAGTGPYCQEAKYGGPAKAFCLQHVKEQCEEQRKQCIEQCIETGINAYERARKSAEDAHAAIAAAMSKAEAECKKTKAYTDVYGIEAPYNSLAVGTNGLRLTYRKIAYYGDIYRYLTGKNPGPSAVSEADIRGIQQNRPVADWDNMTAEIAKAEWDWWQNFAKETEDKLDRICPPAIVPDNTFDDCMEGEKQNAQIATCISTCWYNSLSDCDTVHCMCDQYKCDGPTIDHGPLVPPTEPPPPVPQVEVDNSTRPQTINSTLSEYGLPIELLYGREFLKGNVLWMGDVNEVRGYESTVEFDAPSGTNKTIQKLVIDNYLSFHVGLCAGPVDAISRVWLEGDLIYDKSANADITIESQDRLRIRVLTGEETSRVEAVEAAEIGFGRVPAYRGLAGAFVENINISDLSGFPNLRFEVVKNILDESPTDESDEYFVTGNVEIDHTHRRILAKTDDGLRVLNYDTLASVTLLEVENFIGATDLPNILTHQGLTLAMVDPMHGDELSTLTVPTHDLSFKFRYISPSNAGFQLLGFMMGGDVSFYRVNDMTAQVTLFEELEDVLGDAARTVTPMLMDRTSITSTTLTSSAYSLFLARSAPNMLEIADIMCYNTEQHVVGSGLAYPQLDSGTFESHQLDFDTTDLNLLGTLACPRDKTLIFFVEYDDTYEIVKWHPDAGVSWRTTASNLPNFGAYSPARSNVGRTFSFIDTTGTAQNLDLDTGELSAVSTGNPAPDGIQFYDDQLGAVTYYDGDKFVRVFADRISEDATTVADIIRDIAERSGMQPTDVYTADVDDYEIIGFRSGSAVSGQAILLSLFQVYPTTSFTDRQIVFLKKGTANEFTVDANDVGDKPEITRRDEAHDTKSATIVYDSTATDDSATQTFSLPDDPYEGRNALSFTFTSLISDDYARALAELYVFAAQENDIRGRYYLPPRYLGLTPTDMMLIDGKWRVGVTDTGWDLSTTVEAYSDSPEKYNDIPSLAGTLGFSRIERDRSQKACASLFAIPMRSMSPNHAFDATVFLGAANIFDTFDGEATISQSNNENSNASGSNAVTFTNDVCWGRLVTPPPACSNPFTTQQTATMVVKFATAEHVSRLETMNDDTSYLDPEICLLLVGNEHIQYKTFTVDPDGVTVTFMGLLRARNFTDLDEMTHAAGELVVNWQPDYMHEARNFGGVAYSTNFKYLLTEAPDAAARLDVLFSRDNPDVYRDPGAIAITRQDYPGDGILIRTDLSALQANPYPQFVWTPELDDQVFEVYLLRAAYDKATFDFWRANFDFSDFTYMLSSGSTSEVFIGSEEYFGFFFSESDQSFASFDPNTDSMWAVFVRFGGADGVRETIKVTQFDPGDYVSARQRGVNYVTSY